MKTDDTVEQPERWAPPGPMMSDAPGRPTLVLLNGPNLNLLGERQPEIYGYETLADVEQMCREAAHRHGWDLVAHQSNHEGQLIDWVQQWRHESVGIILNAGGYTHTSIALRDALSATSVPVVEVHVSDIYAREEFRHVSYLSDVCAHHVIGHGVVGYVEAVDWLARVRA